MTETTASPTFFYTNPLRRELVRYITIYTEKGRTVAEFKSSKNAKPLAKIGIKKELFEKFARVFKLEAENQDTKKTTYAVNKDEVFELALLYACILRVVRDKEKLAPKIIDKLLSMHPYELVFWNYKLNNARNRYDQDRVARAFLMLNRLE